MYQTLEWLLTWSAKSVSCFCKIKLGAYYSDQFSIVQIDGVLLVQSRKKFTEKLPEFHATAPGFVKCDYTLWYSNIAGWKIHDL
jgi:hypothetical protein